MGGTWCYIGVLSSLFKAYGDGIISPFFYKHATGSTIVVYIFHWIFVKVFAFWMLKPTLWRENITVVNAWTATFWVITSFVVAVCGSLGVYVFLLRTPPCGKLFGI